MASSTFFRRSRWRYTLILVVVCLAAVAAAAAGWRFARTSSRPSNGPVILVSIDSLRADHLPAYGYRGVRTPAIDALASAGVVFERAHAHSPLTFPSHACILSGRLPFQNGVRDDIGYAIKADSQLLPQMLKKAGYSTGAVVSAPVLGQDAGLAGAFDFYDSEMRARPNAGDGERSGDESLAIAEKWMSSRPSPRFFLFLHLTEPVAPHVTIPRFAQYEPYDSEVAEADAVVGALTKWLKNRGLYDRATIVLLSPHGEGLGDHGEERHGLFLYEESLRVPLVVKLPRDANAGRRVSLPVQHVDLVPTILDLLDMPAPPDLPGRSVRLALIGKKAQIRDRAFYAESFLPHFRFGWSGLQSLTDSRYAFIRAPRIELYDLRQDPGERQNIAATHADVVRSLAATLDGMRAGAPTVDEAAADPKDKLPAYEAYCDAIERAATGNPAGAAEAYKEFLASEPSNAGGWSGFGTVLAGSNQWTEALEAFERAAKIDPANRAAVIGVAAAEFGLGRFDAAKASAERAAQLVPAEAHELLARIALERNEYAVAGAEANLARAANPDLPMPHYVRGVQLCKSGEYEAALRELDEAVRSARGPTRVRDLHYYLGETLSRLERYERAETEWKREVEIFPDNNRARVSLAMLYQAQHREADAGRMIEEIVRFAPTAEGYATAGRLWAIAGNMERANALRAEARERFGGKAPGRSTR